MWWLLIACIPELPAEPQGQGQEWQHKPLSLTRHGRCRMSCRHFDRAEVEQILANGRFVPERTRHDGPCPSHAMEGTTRDGQHARMIFAACADETRLVTAIDLDTDWPCTCD